MDENPYQNLLYEVRDRAAWITVNRPDKLNALNRKTVQEIAAAVERAHRDESVRLLVLTGSGEKAFVAGADIGEMAGMAPTEAQAFSRFLHRTLDLLERGPKPAVAAIRGFALGGGCELAMACHVRIAAEDARFGQPEVNLGLIPGAGGTQRLQRLVGRGRALDLILSGAMIDAAEALRIGLVNRVTPPGELEDRVTEYVAGIAAKSPMALGRALESVIAGGEMALSEAFRLEAGLFGLCFATDDMREGTRAFLEKRKPKFPGR